MFNTIQKTVNASEMIATLEREARIGSKGAVAKIKSAVEDHQKYKEVVVIAIDLKNKKMKINGKKTFEDEFPVVGGYAETYKNAINSLTFTGKTEEEAAKLKKALLNEDVVNKIVLEKYALLEDGKPYMELLVKETRYLDFGKFLLDLSK